jgi:branched-chain amino acid transport system substrate-binding protein
LVAMRAAMVAAVVAAAGCRSDTTPIVFAAAAPWREDYSSGTRQGIELAVDEINAAGGIGGRPLRIRWADDGGTASGAVTVAGALVADPSVLAVIGHINSSAQLAAAALYDGHLTAISPQATSPDLTGASHWVFRDLPSDSTNGATLAQFAAHLGARRAAVLYENDVYGRGLATAFRRHFSGTVVAIEPIDGNARTYEPYVTYLKRLRPDAVFVAGLGTSGTAILREAKRQGLTAAFLGGDGWTSVAADTVSSEGVYVATPFLSADPRPVVRRFDAMFSARYHFLPEEDMALAYDATRVLADAVRHGARRRPEVRAYLAGLTAEHPFQGVTGPLYFLPSGDPAGRQFVMSRIHGGAFLPATAQ